jgi:hypothetical protein
MPTQSDPCMPAGGFQVFVKTLTGKTIALNVESFASIAHIKHLIQVHEGVPCAMQRLLFENKLLQNDRALADYGIEQDATLRLQPGFRPIQQQHMCTEDVLAYHGTSPDSAAAIEQHGFQASTGGLLGAGVYVSRDLTMASRYGPVVLELRVSLGNTLRVDWMGHPKQLTWHDHGFDSAWVPPNCGMVSSELEQHCVWDPTRVRVVRRVPPAPLEP